MINRGGGPQQYSTPDAANSAYLKIVYRTLLIEHYLKSISNGLKSIISA